MFIYTRSDAEIVVNEWITVLSSRGVSAQECVLRRRLIEQKISSLSSEIVAALDAIESGAVEYGPDVFEEIHNGFLQDEIAVVVSSLRESALERLGAVSVGGVVLSPVDQVRKFLENGES